MGIEEGSSASIEYTNSNFKINSFHKDIDDIGIYFEVIKMNNALFIWISKQKERVFKDLSVAMISQFQDTPLSTQIMGSALDSTSSKIASKLAKKLDKQIFVTCNIPINNSQLLLLQQGILEEIKLHPDNF